MQDEEKRARQREYQRAYRAKNLEKAREQERLKAARSRNESRDAYNAYMREWRNKNKDKINAELREKRKTDPEYAEKIRARDRLRPREQLKNKRLNQFYGITLDEYNKMREEQNFSCPICGKHEDNCGKHKLVVDHCHTTGKVRQLLCAQCNAGIGHLKESESILTSAIAYLRKHRKE